MKKIFGLIIACVVLLMAAANAFAADTAKILEETAEYIYGKTPSPQVSTVGGEWTVVGLARSGFAAREGYYSDYYNRVCEYAKKCGGVFSERKYTEYSRVVIALTAIGENPAEVAGYNLLMPLADYEKNVRQGINGAAWVLIALDCGGYEIPYNPAAEVQATRQMYVERILDCQLSGGGWAIGDESIADPDITAMSLIALAPYRADSRVEEAVENAIACLSAIQNADGGFSSRGEVNSESCAQIIVALCELGISPEDARFVKNGNTLMDNLLSYYNPGAGFSHTKDGGENLMASEQCFYSLVAAYRFVEGKNSIYNMSDAEKITGETGSFKRNPAVEKTQVLYPGKTFADISENREAIEILSQRAVISGKTDNSFEPDSTMTRAEFATIVTRGLGLDFAGDAVFSDVNEQDWFFDYVNTAHYYGIVNGVSEREFNPHGTIKREEAAVMLEKAAGLCGMNTQNDIFSARDTLAVFDDYVQTSAWAIKSLAFCCDNGIIDSDEIQIRPKEAVTRSQIARMVYNLMKAAQLL